MNLKEFRKQTKHFKDDFEVVISGKSGRSEVYGVISCGKKDKKNCLIIPKEDKKSFRELLADIKKLIANWVDDNEELSMWVHPIPMAALDIELRNMAGKSCFWLTTWYNLNLLTFKIFGALKILDKKKQEYYDACEEYKNEKKAGAL